MWAFLALYSCLGHPLLLFIPGRSSLFLFPITQYHAGVQNIQIDHLGVLQPLQLQDVSWARVDRQG